METTHEQMNFSHEKMAEMTGWQFFSGFVGDECGACKATVNVPHGPGWFCPCGHYNILPYSNRRMTFEAPTHGPTREAIQAAWEEYRNRPSTIFQEVARRIGFGSHCAFLSPAGVRGYFDLEYLQELFPAMRVAGFDQKDLDICADYVIEHEIGCNFKPEEATP